MAELFIEPAQLANDWLQLAVGGVSFVYVECDSTCTARVICKFGIENWFEINLDFYYLKIQRLGV